MIEQKLSRKVYRVHQAFDTDQLPSYLDCYSLLAQCTVIVEGQHRPYMAIFDPETDHITCDCDQFQRYDKCDHLQALLAGLWPHLSSFLGNASLITCTHSWNTDTTFLAQARPAATH